MPPVVKKTTLAAPSGFTSGGVVATPEDPKPGIPVMSEQQWDRIYRKVSRIKQPANRWENLGWAMVGLFVASTFGLFTWIQGNVALDATERVAVIWQGWIYSTTAIVAAVLLVTSILAQRGRTNQLVRDKEDALEEMRDFHTPMSTKPEEPPNA